MEDRAATVGAVVL